MCLFETLFLLQGNDSDNAIEHSPGKKEVVFFSFKQKPSLKKKVHFLRTKGPKSLIKMIILKTYCPSDIGTSKLVLISLKNLLKTETFRNEDGTQDLVL